MKVLGISAFAHDSAAAIVIDNEIVASAEEERFNRKKHTGEFPRQAIHYCLNEAGIETNQLDKITFFLNARPDFPQSHIDVYKVVGLWAIKHTHAFKNGFLSALKNPKSLENMLNNSTGIINSITNWGKIVRRELGLDKKYSPELIGVPHHKCHIGSSFMISGYKNAAILIADQRGELDASTLAFGNNQHVDILKSITLPDSLGSLYGLFTSYLGFRALSGEGKVMGLSSYGEPRYINEFNRYLELQSDGLYKLNTNYIDFAIGAFAHFFPEDLIEELGDPRNSASELEQNHYDIAKSLQMRLEEALFSLCEYIRARQDFDRLCLSGGIALNSAANGRIARELFGIQEVYVPPAPGDAGTALGSAVWTAAQSSNNGYFKLESPYLGPGFRDADCKKALDDTNLPYKRFDNISKIGAKVLNQDKIIAWFQGRMEFGPRALGNRSILANPKRIETRDRLNELKGRELWRPLAPSFLQNKVNEYFTHNCKSPFMSFVVPVRPEMINKIPACVHVDGTARLQTVEYSSNPKYWELIKEFEELTGLPCVINTSFNIRGEPIVCNPQDAVQSFLKMNLDYLFLGDYVTAKDATAIESL
jgi:carbamoyltransferase